MGYPSVWIAIGTVMIALGGLVATYGWNLQADMARKDALIRAMAAETMLNGNIVNDPKLTASGSDFVMFPRANHVALDGAIGSGLFTAENDRELLSRATALREMLVSLNQRLEFTENRMAADPASVSVFRSRLSEGRTLDGVRQAIAAFNRQLVQRKYLDEEDAPFAEH